MPQLERIAWLTAALSATVFGIAIAADAPTPANIPLQDLQIRAEAGDRTATRQLAEAYYLGKGVEQDFKIASQWYEKLAKQGDVRAQTSLGLMYARGYGVDCDNYISGMTSVAVPLDRISIGSESWCAVAIAVAAFATPAPVISTQTPGLPVTRA